jgi:hypothetical protein
MIVWGGYSGNTTLYGDGAAYDPATRTWAKLAASPLAGRALPVTVWTAAANTWRTLAPIPGSLGGNLTGSGSYAVWTGKVMLVCSRRQLLLQGRQAGIRLHAVGLPPITPASSAPRRRWPTG